MSCYCGSGKEYKDCCELIHNDHSQGKTAESVMRARYSAFVAQKVEFVGKTHAPGTSDFNLEEAKVWAKESNWKSLEIVSTKAGLDSDEQGIVEFKANYEDSKGSPIVHHEVSEFKKIDGSWFYNDGQIVGTGTYQREGDKIGRNDPCSCGSGKKFKKCCG